MSDFNVRPIGDLEILNPLLAQLHEAGAVETTDVPSLVLVGAASVLEAELLLLNISPLLRRRTVIVGIDEPLDFGFVPGSHTALLAQMQVLGSLPSNCAASPTITSFIGARGHGDGLAYLVGAAFWKLGPSDHKVWFNFPAMSAGEFLVHIVTTIERETTWFDEPPRRRSTI